MQRPLRLSATMRRSVWPVPRGAVQQYHDADDGRHRARIDRILAGGVKVFAEKCLALMEPNEAQCRQSLERSLMTVTGLNLYIGYEKASALAKKALKTGRTIREVCEEENVLSKEELDNALDPRRMIKPHE